MDAKSVDAYQDVATRIVARYLAQSGMRRVRPHLGTTPGPGFPNVDITFERFGAPKTGKVKGDPYCGTDQRLIDDRSLTYYRGDGGGFAFEVISDAITRRDGWAMDPSADWLYYYCLALGDTEERLADVAAMEDEAFFAKITVARDDLYVIPMGPLSEWFRAHSDGYTSRPVDAGNRTAWYKVVPHADVERAVPGVERPGPIFRTLT